MDFFSSGAEICKCRLPFNWIDAGVFIVGVLAGCGTASILRTWFLEIEEKVNSLQRATDGNFVDTNRRVYHIIHDLHRVRERLDEFGDDPLEVTGRRHRRRRSESE